MVNSTPRPFYPPGRTRSPLYRRLIGPRGRPRQMRKIPSPLDFDPRTVQPVASDCLKRHQEVFSPACWLSCRLISFFDWVMNAWRYTSFPPVHFKGAVVVKHRSTSYHVAYVRPNLQSICRKVTLLRCIRLSRKKCQAASPLSAEKIGRRWMDFHETFISDFHSNLSIKFKFGLNRAKISAT